jgi:hypothetical protein
MSESVPPLSQFECEGPDSDDDSVTESLPIDHQREPPDVEGESHAPPTEGHRAPSGGGEDDMSLIDLDLDPRAPVEHSTIATPVLETSDPGGKRAREDEHDAEEEPSDKHARTVEAPLARPVDPSPESGEDSPSLEFNCEL